MCLICDMETLFLKSKSEVLDFPERMHSSEPVVEETLDRGCQLTLADLEMAVKMVLAASR